MKTVCIETYQFEELTLEAKERAIKDKKNDGIETDYIYDEALKTVQKFNQIFDLEEGNKSWLDFTIPGNEHLESLKGMRLRTYIINNFGKYFYKGKYFSLWSKTEKSFKHHKEGFPVLKTRHSKVLFEHSCVLTGVCYDESMLQPIYEFLEWNLRPDYNSYQDFENLISDCFQSLKEAIEKEIDYRNSDESIIEEFTDNEYNFTITGKIFN